jgi:predicted nucleic acid-binding protein
MKIYLDSSALVKAISNEKDSAEFRSVLDGWMQEGNEFVSSIIAEVEVRRALHKTSVPQSAATELFELVETVVADRPIAVRAGLLAIPGGLPYLRSMDALHVATAEFIQPKFAVTFDDKQATAFNDAGINTWNELVSV